MLVWRFSGRVRVGGGEVRRGVGWLIVKDGRGGEKVSGLRRFWEGVGVDGACGVRS